jgi:hypothetical protein
MSVKRQKQFFFKVLFVVSQKFINGIKNMFGGLEDHVRLYQPLEFNWNSMKRKNVMSGDIIENSVLFSVHNLSIDVKNI